MPEPGEFGTILFDLDGTLVKHGTTEWLPGALFLIEMVEARGYEVRFMTRRGDREFEDHPVYGKAPTITMLAGAGLGSRHIWFDVRSPRGIVDDSVIWFHPRQTNTEFDIDDLLLKLDVLEGEEGPE
jgi:hypothetical protein